MEPFEGLNWALLKKVQVIAYENVSFSPDENPIDFSDIFIESGEDFEEIPFIFESAGFRETEEFTVSGQKWNKEVVMRIPKLRSAVSAFLDKYSGRKLVLLVTDMNAESHLVFPVRMTRQRNIPGQATALNATEITFSGEWNTESPLVANVT
jgi:hypothetical protein